MNYTLKDIQTIQLNLLKYFVKICEKENINYFVTGGTLLGTIRHNGFIPWDDDIDVVMLRDEYERFLKVAPKYMNGNIRLVNSEIDHKYLYYYSKLEDLTTETLNALNKKEQIHIAMDIFAIDGFPNNILLRKLHVYHIFYHHALTILCNTDILKVRDRGTFNNFIVSALKLVARIIPFNKITNTYTQKKKIEELLKKYSFKKSNFVGPLLAAKGEREIVPKDCFVGYDKHMFEGIEVSIPKNYDKYLTYIYGDYMKIPKEKDRDRIQHYGQINN